MGVQRYERTSGIQYVERRFFHATTHFMASYDDCHSEYGMEGLCDQFAVWHCGFLERKPLKQQNPTEDFPQEDHIPFAFTLVFQMLVIL